VVSESFLPQVNGVTNSVLRVLEHLRAAGHQATVLAPGEGGVDSYSGFPVAHLPSVRMPRYADVAVSLAGTRTLAAALERFEPDVVHLAGPFAVGPPTLRAADRLGVPVVSVFQTDFAGFARQYGFTVAESWVWRRLQRIHGNADRTLVPSTPTLSMLREHEIPRLALWPRGVDAERFNPRHRSEAFRSRLVGAGDVLVGYVGRLAQEKEVDHLRALVGLPGVRLVIIGDGPARAELARALPDATFLGFLGGSDLSVAAASLDVMVHTGRHETFCQSVQEALASGVPVVAPASGGPLDLVDPSRTGWLYTPGDLDDLRDRVRDLAGDEAKRRAMGRAARESVAHRTWPEVGRALVRHYRSALGHSSIAEAA
jgi:phosphatidylinositol alpha 1,6-mannosyltransferase